MRIGFGGEVNPDEYASQSGSNISIAEDPGPRDPADYRPDPVDMGLRFYLRQGLHGVAPLCHRSIPVQEPSVDVYPNSC